MELDHHRDHRLVGHRDEAGHDGVGAGALQRGRQAQQLVAGADRGGADVAGRQHDEPRGATQLLEVEHRQHPVGQPQAREHRVVDPERAVAGEVGDVGALERGEHRVDPGTSPPKTLADGYTVDSAASSASAPGSPGPAASDHPPVVERSGRGAERAQGRHDRDRHGRRRTAAPAHGSACSGPVGQTTRASGRRPPASNGATSASVQLRRRVLQRAQRGGLHGRGPATAGQPAQREQRRPDQAVDVGRARRRGRA